MIIDVHAHLNQASVEKDKKIILEASERYGIDKLFISTVTKQFPSAEAVDWQNEQTCKFMKEQPNLIEGYVYINPRNANSMDALRRGIEDDGMIGVKLWADCYANSPSVFPIAEYAAETGIPLLFHSFHKTHDQLPYETVSSHIAKLAERYPETKILMAHLGGNCYHGIPGIRKYPNVYVDISGSQFRDDALMYALEYLGEDRILFGTDMPFFYLDAFGAVEDAELTEIQREKILHRNALKLFDRSFKLGKEVKT